MTIYVLEPCKNKSLCLYGFQGFIEQLQCSYTPRGWTLAAHEPRAAMSRHAHTATLANAVVPGPCVQPASVHKEPTLFPRVNLLTATTRCLSANITLHCAVRYTKIPVIFAHESYFRLSPHTQQFLSLCAHIKVRPSPNGAAHLRRAVCRGPRP
jgi:hypothetical protein